MPLLDDLLATLPDGDVVEVCIGIHWSAVVVETNGVQRCGLATTLLTDHEHHLHPDVPVAGELLDFPARELAAQVKSDQPTMVGVGMAAVNALLPPLDLPSRDLNAEEVIARLGTGKPVALIGHFPFIPRLEGRVGQLTVLERTPRPGDLPASAAPQVLPEAEVVAITGMALLNGSMEDLLALCQPDAQVIVLGPTTPLSPVLFDYGVDFLSGSLVTDIEAVLRCIRQGGNFRQVHKAGVRLVTYATPQLIQALET